VGSHTRLLEGSDRAHEVVVTIMMNYISYSLSNWLLNGPMKAPGFRPLTPVIENSGHAARFFPDPLRFNWGFVLALAIAVFVYWFLFKPPSDRDPGSGSQPGWSRYAGMNIVKKLCDRHELSGSARRPGGATQYWALTTGWDRAFLPAMVLIRSRSPCWARSPLWSSAGSLLWGTLRSGATSMQFTAGVPIEIISIIQGLVIVFVAAPAVIRWIYHIRSIRTETTVLTRGWVNKRQDECWPLKRYC